MDQVWPAGEQLIAADDEPSLPQTPEPRAAGAAPRPRGGDAAALDWATVQALTFTANGLAG